MDELFTEYPFYGYRKMYNQLKNEGMFVGKDKVLKYMRVLGLETFYPEKKNLSSPNKENKIYPYLLRGIKIKRPNQVWSIDITYIRMASGFMYLAAIIDWYSKYLLSYKLSNSLEMNFCIETLKDALNSYGNPEIINSDQGSQFTSMDFTTIVSKNDIKISMDSKGRALDNIAIERFFRSLKYENIYINEYNDVKELKEGINRYIEFYNLRRLHQTLKYKTPAEIYQSMA